MLYLPIYRIIDKQEHLSKKQCLHVLQLAKSGIYHTLMWTKTVRVIEDQGERMASRGAGGRVLACGHERDTTAPGYTPSLPDVFRGVLV